MSEIKNCPFCGSEADVKSFTTKKFMKSSTGYYVKCKSCGNQSALELERQSTIEKWNRRKPIGDMVEQLKEKSVETIPTCAVDGYSMTEEENMVFLDDAIDIVRGGRE